MPGPAESEKATVSAGMGVGRSYCTKEAHNNAGLKAAAERVEGKPAIGHRARRYRTLARFVDNSYCVPGIPPGKPVSLESPCSALKPFFQGGAVQALLFAACGDEVPELVARDKLDLLFIEPLDPDHEGDGIAAAGYDDGVNWASVTPASRSVFWISIVFIESPPSSCAAACA